MGLLRDQVLAAIESETEDDALCLALRRILHGPMSARQREVAELLLEGCVTKEIAQLLKIEERTVKAHFSALYRRYGIGGMGKRGGRGTGRVALALLLCRRQAKGEPW